MSCLVLSNERATILGVILSTLLEKFKNIYYGQIKQHLPYKRKHKLLKPCKKNACLRSTQDQKYKHESASRASKLRVTNLQAPQHWPYLPGSDSNAV